MFEILPEKLKKMSAALGKPLYVVGGACRDFAAGLKSCARDWDICAPASAEEAENAARAAGLEIGAVYKNTGTVRLGGDGEEYEFTSFRTDRYVRGAHTPAEVFFTGDIGADARRRDFKCNAVYYDISARKFVDPLGGLDDIRRGIISTVVSAKKVFGEDGLRLMRLCRIAAQTGFKPDAECMAGARENAALIADIAPERIYAELNALLNADKKYGVAGAHAHGLRLLNETGVLALILPELALGDKMEQRKDFHAYDVLEHSLKCAEYAPPQIRLAALLHDVGKPYCKLNFGKYAGHEEAGAEIARKILERLRAPKREIRRVCELIRLHMYDLSGAASENKVRKFIVKNLEILPDLLLLKQADFSACKDDMSVAPCVKKWNAILSRMRDEGVPMTLKQLDVRGDELIRAGICAGETAETLQFLLGECAIGNVPNEKERLIRYALARR